MNERMMFDIGKVMDEIFGAAQSFSETFKENFKENFKEGFRPGEHSHGPWFWWNENVDFYPAFQYPPANIYITEDKHLVFEFALAGFDEVGIDLKFQGDYMVLSARVPADLSDRQGVRYFKRRLKLRDIEGQRYYAPADKFDQSKVKAVFKNGILRVDLPPNEEVQTDSGVRIEIVKEGE